MILKENLKEEKVISAFIQFCYEAKMCQRCSLSKRNEVLLSDSVSSRQPHHVEVRLSYPRLHEGGSSTGLEKCCFFLLCCLTNMQLPQRINLLSSQQKSLHMFQLIALFDLYPFSYPGLYEGGSSRAQKNDVSFSYAA